jgi:hypothetical protein
MRFQIRTMHLAAGLLLALAALALLPTVARAANSSEKVYIPGVPSIESKGSEATPTPKAKPKPKPKSHPGSPAAKEGTAEPTTRPEAEPEEEETERHPSAAAHPGEGGNKPPGGKAKPKGASSSHHPDGSKPATTNASRGEMLTPTTIKTAGSSGGGGDGSSPVVPILIAVAVLAALSIGVAFYRERHRDASASA